MSDRRRKSSVRADDGDMRTRAIVNQMETQLQFTAYQMNRIVAFWYSIVLFVLDCIVCSTSVPDQFHL